MRAAVYDDFNRPPTIQQVGPPAVPDDGVVLDVMACGVCRSDITAWHGLDPGIRPPWIPGHELAGVIAAVGKDVESWTVGDRVTLPFSTGCGACRQCERGDDQNCDDQFQPGFTGPGGFAEQVAIPRADRNLVRIPQDMEFSTAALLGCRFGTAYRAVRQQTVIGPGTRLAVFGAGGLGLTAVMIAAARGADIVAIDRNPRALQLAARVGAATVLEAGPDVPSTLLETTGGGVDVTLDCVGHPEVAAQALASLAKRGRHVQVGLLLEGLTPLPMDLVVARELEIVGSHGIAAASYPHMLDEIARGDFDPTVLLTGAIGLEQLADAWRAMEAGETVGVSVVTEF